MDKLPRHGRLGSNNPYKMPKNYQDSQNKPFTMIRSVDSNASYGYDDAYDPFFDAIPNPDVIVQSDANTN